MTHRQISASDAPGKPPLRGIICASLTPVSTDGSIDVPRLAAHIRGLFDDGCSFVSPFGSTGEGASFSVREKIAALGALRDAGIEMRRLIPAAISAALDDAAEIVRFGAEAGCRAVLVAPPSTMVGPARTASATSLPCWPTGSAAPCRSRSYFITSRS